MTEPRLLVSVTSVDEARRALAGHADIIDIKDPARGSLGRASTETIQAIRDTVAAAAPVSAALGELIDLPADLPGELGAIATDLAFTKVGLARAPDDWQDQLTQLAEKLNPQRFVAAAYADADRADAPPVESVIQWACQTQAAGVLIDTAHKDGQSLLDFCDPATLTRWGHTLHARGLFLALAGSLHLHHLPTLRQLPADILAVRSSVCAHANRLAAIDPARITRWRQALRPEPTTP